MTTVKTIPTYFGPQYVAQTKSTSMRKITFIVEELKKFEDIQLINPLDGDFINPIPAILKTHDPLYVKRFLNGIKGDGLQAGCDAAFGMWNEDIRNGVLAMHSGQLKAVEMVLKDPQKYPIVANIAQGYHHARYEKGTGYCTFNGFAVTAKAHPNKVFGVMDVDEHEGDGTTSFAVNTPNLWNATVHGTSLNVPITSKAFARACPGFGRIRSDKYLDCVREGCEWLLSKEIDVVLYNAGMDCHRDDPYGYAKLDDETIFDRDRLVFEFFLKKKIPVVFCVAGGYQEDLTKIAKIHALTWRAALYELLRDNKYLPT